MRSIFFIFSLFLCITAGAQTRISDPSLSSATHFLRNHYDVSIINAQPGDLLFFNSLGYWENGSFSSAISIPDSYVTFMNGGSLTGSSNFTYDGANLQVTAGVNPAFVVNRTSSGAAYFKMVNTLNEWWIYVNNTTLGIEPNGVNGNIDFRNLANTVLFRLNLTSGFFENLAGTTIRVTGKGGTATGLAAFDSSSGLTSLTGINGGSITTGTLNITPAASAVSVAASPANYTAGSANVESHFIGVDNAIGSTTHKILAFTQIEDTATEVVQRGEEITIDGDNTASSSFTVTLDITGLETGDVFDIYIGDATVNNITLQLSSGTNNLSYERDGLSTTKTFSGAYHSLYCRWDGSALRIDER